MSLILEALRRSEAQRQLGRAPDVLAPMAVPRVSRQARRWPWWLAFALTLATLWLWTWWRTSQHGERQALTSTSTPPSTPATTAHVADIGARTTQEIRPMPPDIIGTVTAPPTPAVLVAVNKQTPASDDPQAGTGTPRQDAAMPTPLATTAHPSPTISAASTIAAAQPTPAVSAPAPDVPGTTPNDADALLSIADLPSSERAALPALKVSMHVWAEQPGDRFMIVDGERVGEGARLGDRIVLVQIRRDGGVLDIGGRRLLLPKP